MFYLKITANEMKIDFVCVNISRCTALGRRSVSLPRQDDTERRTERSSPSVAPRLWVSKKREKLSICTCGNRIMVGLKQRESVATRLQVSKTKESSVSVTP